MFGHIYKIGNDPKYHIWNWKTMLTDCGKPMTSITEDRIIGMKEKYYPDPDRKDVCRICFKFLDFSDLTD